MTPKERLGRRVKALREKRKLSQVALAKRAGVSRGYLARLEIGYHDPTVTMLVKLAKALRVKVTQLLE